MAVSQKFLIVDDNPDGSGLLVRTLRRKYPAAEILECVQAGDAVARAASENWDVIIAHRSAEMDAEELVRALREVSPLVPILVVSGIDRTAKVKAAGGSAFLNYDAWLMLGDAVEKLIADEQR